MIPHGSAVAASGKVIRRDDYAAFGEEISRTGAAATRFGYQGTAWMRKDSGLYVSPTRLYLPTEARLGQKDRRQFPRYASQTDMPQQLWLTTKDGDMTSRRGRGSAAFYSIADYLYARNQPSTGVDPTGLETCELFLKTKPRVQDHRDVGTLSQIGQSRDQITAIYVQRLNKISGIYELRLRWESIREGNPNTRRTLYTLEAHSQVLLYCRLVGPHTCHAERRLAYAHATTSGPLMGVVSPLVQIGPDARTVPITVTTPYLAFAEGPTAITAAGTIPPSLFLRSWVFVSEWQCKCVKGRSGGFRPA